MGKYVIESKFENTRCFLEVACENRETYFFINRVDSLTPYTEPDLDAIKQEEYEKGYKTAKVQCDIQTEKDLREVGERHYQKGYQDATVKISSNEQAIAEKAYQRGLADAWETARTLWNTPNRKEIFGYTTFSTTLTTLTAQETIEKIRQYEQEQEEQIQVGDEVKNTQTGVKFIVTHLWENNRGEQGVSGFNQECSAFSTTLSLVVKTGRTFPEIASVLEKMREKS